MDDAWLSADTMKLRDAHHELTELLLLRKETEIPLLLAFDEVQKTILQYY
jgi:hypothetical protein